ncbi:MAG: UDP-2,4-diacetamido-2,4,6-trideoxy-beta-L-altropyranose hydrolase [Lachnospiraceae bacterium]|nr:UDP-2,4-diacetamido-2,4,6-trideoxy-beta-L-altropyranose hydrolase [Lachnospiraceae bacterium]
MEQLVIGIRADGSAQIGMGHLMRCLSVAEALKDRQAQVVFLTNSANSAAFITEKGFACRLLENAGGKFGEASIAEQAAKKPDRNMLEEVPETLSIIRELHMKLLLVDSYSATAEYFHRLRPAVSVIYMDDLGTMQLPVDGLMNYNIYGDTLPYREAYPKDTLLLLGSSYAPVKKQFRAAAYEVREQAKRILITMGGSDFLNISGRLADRLLQQLPADIQLVLVCGRFSPHLDKVLALAEEHTQITVLTDVQDMWNVMSSVDLAIAAAGSTMYELCTLGVPTVCCYYVENQRRVAEGFGTRTSMVNAGDFSKEPEQVLDRITCAASELLADFRMRKELSEEMHRITDGLGACRMADKLIHFILKRMEKVRTTPQNNYKNTR